MPRPPLPKIAAHSLALRARSLRALLEIVREKYPQHWRELIDAARGCGDDVEAVSRSITAWLRARRLLDEPEHVAAAEAWLLLAREPELEILRRGRPALLFLTYAVRDYLPKRSTPEPVILEVKYLLGEGMPWKFGLQFGELRAHILADFAAKLDDALAQYRRNCEAAGLAEAAAGGAEKERLEWLAKHLIERRSIPSLAAEKHHEPEALRKALAAAAAACGLRLTRRAPKTVK